MKILLIYAFVFLCYYDVYAQINCSEEIQENWDMEKISHYFQEKITLAHQEKKYLEAFQFKECLAKIARQKQLPEYEIHYWRSALQYAEKHSLRREIGVTHINLGNYYKDYKLDKAAFHFKVASEVFYDTPFTNELAIAYQELSALELRLQNYEKAINLAQKTLVFCQDDVQKIKLYITLGKSWRELQNYKESLINLQEALHLAQKKRYQNWVALVSCNMGESYFLMKDYPTAYTFIQKSIDIATQKRSFGEVVDALNLLVQMALEKNELQKADSLFREIDRNYTIYQLEKKSYVKTLALKVEWEKKRKNYENALLLLEKSIYLRDSIDKEENIKEAKKVEAEFEAQEKDHKIKVLEEEKQNSLAFEAKQSQAIFWISTTLLLVVIFMVSFYRKNKKIEKINRLLKEKHYEVVESQRQLSEQNKKLYEQKYRLMSANLIISTINRIGEKITSLLEKDKITEILHKELLGVMDAYAFGIAVYDSAYQRLNFDYFIENNLLLPPHYDQLTEEKLSVLCFKKGETIVINDLEKEYHKLLLHFPEIQHGELCQSLIYVPIKSKQKKLGVLTVQSPRKEAYPKEVVELMEMLASYVAIALDNSEAYHIIRDKNAKITKDITYARSIQEGFLPTPEKMTQVLGNHFIIFKPKEIVSGDFYWAVKTEHENIFALADCTGHGVAGGFMSLIGVTLLNQFVKKDKINSPAQLLKKLDTSIMHTLRQTNLDDKSGMEIAIVKFKMTEHGYQLTYSGSKLPLYVFAENLEKIPASRKYLGRHGLPPDFVDTQIDIPKNSTHIYITTDGLFDQQNAAHKRFGTALWEESLKKCQHLPLEQQKEYILQILEAHQQDMPQRDDISILGIFL